MPERVDTLNDKIWDSPRHQDPCLRIRVRDKNMQDFTENKINAI